MAITGYRILRKIRQGGMSTVYLAIQKSVDREVALKVMSPSLTVDPSFGSRFYREAKIVGQLSHPNIVSIYDVGSYKQYNYIAMDYLPGAPLQDQLKQGVSASQALKITSDIAAALDYAHNHGYIHRDIKPDNILFRTDGTAVLCDFGIAKSLKGSVNMTNVGSVLGTPHYMSPEQAQGKNVDGRADLYGLGGVLYEMLSGQVPFPGDDPIAIAVKHVSAPIPKLPAEHRKFQPLINRLLAKKPNARFQTGKELIEAISELQSSMAGSKASYLTSTSSTTLQVMGLVRALSSTLTSALGLSIRRVILGKKAFTGKSVLLTQRQLEEIDDFVLDESSTDQSLPTQSDATAFVASAPSLTQKSYRPWIYGPLALLTLAVTVFVFMDIMYPEQLRDVYSENVEEITQRSIDKPNIETVQAIQRLDSISSKPPEELLEQQELTLPQSLEPESETFALTINPTPDNARVRILNIRPTYQPEIELPPGAYHIEVSAKDYQTNRFWLQVSDKAISQPVRLRPTRKLLPVGTMIVDKLAGGGESAKMIVLPSDQSGTINSPIAMGQYEVTYAQFDLFVTSTDRPLPEDFNWGRGSRPVVGITYNEATDYAKWLSEQTGQSYRLPTRQEWEYAAKSQRESKFWWGDNELENSANCRRGCKSKWSKFFGSSTAPVGSFPANGENLYDMVGNAAEWLNTCSLWKDVEETQCTERFVAGGSHQDTANKIGRGMVSAVAADKGSKAIGLRLVLDL